VSHADIGIPDAEDAKLTLLTEAADWAPGKLEDIRQVIAQDQPTHNAPACQAVHVSA